MSNMTSCHTGKHVEVPCIDRVGALRPLTWLKLGWSDLKKLWPLSLLYGVAVAFIGYALVYQGWVRPYAAMALTSGFMLIGPFLAAGLYDLSLRRERSQVSSETLRPFATIRDNITSIALFGLLLAFMLSAWERLSAILIGVFLGSSGVPEASFAWLFSAANPGFLIAYMGFGLLFALLVFALSVVSLPMLMDRPVDIVTAIMTSFWVVWGNPLAMLVWASLIVVLVAVGVATAFVGLVVIFPLLGHATWHAYRELVVK